MERSSPPKALIPCLRDQTHAAPLGLDEVWETLGYKQGAPTELPGGCADPKT